MRSAGAPLGQIGLFMGYEPASGRLILTGGGGQWSWSGSQWQAGTQPASRRVLSAAYDAARGEALIYSGNAGAETWVLVGGTYRARGVCDAWLWDGTTWAPLPLACGPRNELGLVRASSPAALMLAAAGASVPLGACVLHVDPQTTVSVPFTSSAAGFFSLPLPLGPTLPLGLDLFGQAVVIDPAGAFAGLAFTNGLQLTIGE